MIATLLALSGCAVGVVSIRTPERLPPEGLPALTRPLRFDVCLRLEGWEPSTTEFLRHGRLPLGDALRTALARAGVEAELVSIPGSAAHFTVAQPAPSYEHGWSMMLSMFTLSVVPGYAVERHPLHVNIASTDASRAGRPEHVEYETTVSHFVWVPLIVHPDYVASINGAWQSARYEEGGFERMVQRLADDLRARFGRAGAVWNEADGVTCPTPPERSEPPPPSTP